jgi:hypothetical protein
MGIYACVRFMLRKPTRDEYHILDKRIPQECRTSITNMSMRMLIWVKSIKNTSTYSHTLKTSNILESIPQTLP